MTYEELIRQLPAGAARQSAIDLHDTMTVAKQVLLANRVQNFTAAEVVELTRMLIEREEVLRARTAGVDGGA